MNVNLLLLVLVVLIVLGVFGHGQGWYSTWPATGPAYAGNALVLVLVVLLILILLRRF